MVTEEGRIRRALAQTQNATSRPKGSSLPAGVTDSDLRPRESDQGSRLADSDPAIQESDQASRFTDSEPTARKSDQGPRFADSEADLRESSQASRLADSGATTRESGHLPRFADAAPHVRQPEEQIADSPPRGSISPLPLSLHYSPISSPEIIEIPPSPSPSNPDVEFMSPPASPSSNSDVEFIAEHPPPSLPRPQYYYYNGTKQSLIELLEQFPLKEDPLLLLHREFALIPEAIDPVCLSSVVSSLAPTDRILVFTPYYRDLFAVPVDLFYNFFSPSSTVTLEEII
ncbi:histone-lysine N-methyltransferase 2D isoform X1 [Monomorium pharaonis]|uniref:histone-lysine N-methyltransferase 2D isoform X1 n=1 Tax=Monomorium pharaonis TaxID=307658 RepID=UPI001745D8E2|nr:histone-lysine N-methyltransferase 2D isoform X1 [Monomorium pharaonis]